MDNKIKYNGFNYIVVRTEGDNGNTDIALMSFPKMSFARQWMKTDIKNTLTDLEKTEDDMDEYSKDCAVLNYNGDYIQWEIRKIHNRVDGNWENPNHPTKWEKVN